MFWGPIIAAVFLFIVPGLLGLAWARFAGRRKEQASFIDVTRPKDSRDDVAR